MSADPLTAIAIKRLESPGFYAAGGVKGLYLRVNAGGSRSWILRVTVGHKRRDIGLGGYPDVTLSMARDKARECRELIRSGIDPVDQRKADKQALKSRQAKAITFKQAALRCHATKQTEFRNEKHRHEWITALENHAFPTIGNMQIAEIDVTHVLEMLEKIWHTKTETATRVRQRTEAVITWATVSGFRSGDNPARWDGNLKELLPNPAKIAPVKHFRSLHWQKVGQFMKDLRIRPGIAARALEFAILTAARSGEVRGMTWDEIDMDAGIWVVPETRIKAGKKHTVPLSDSAKTILAGLPRFEECPYVFPSPRGGMLSDATLSAVLKRMDVDAVPHGFRSTFKDWARSCTVYPDEVSELALAHVNNDATRAAYARDELLPKRALLMRDWEKFCALPLKSSAVTPIRNSK